MKKASLFTWLSIFLFTSAVTLVSCGETNTETEETDTTAMTSDATEAAVATLSGTTPDVSLNGTVTFTQDGDQVRMSLQISVPSKANESVAVHIHAMGDCGDMGKMAGGHWNPTNEEHGRWGSSTFHSGDIGNVDLDASGNGSMDLSTDRWAIGGDTTKNILDKTIIVHNGTDDYTSQPAGNSGDRIGCGVIRKSGM